MKQRPPTSLISGILENPWATGHDYELLHSAAKKPLGLKCLAISVIITPQITDMPARLSHMTNAQYVSFGEEALLLDCENPRICVLND